MKVVSVIVVTLNAAKTIQATLQSVVDQSYSSLEIIVVDGGSIDRTIELVQNYIPFIKNFTSEPDQGIYDAMNKGIKVSTGEYLLFMNSGDYFNDVDVISRMMDYVDESSETVVFAPWVEVRKNNRKYHRIPNCSKCIFNHQATLYSRSIHSWHGFYLSIKGLTAADYLFFRTLQLSCRVKFNVCPYDAAIVDPYGVSFGVQTYMQCRLIEMLCGIEGRFLGAAKILMHPMYSRIKRIFFR